MADHGAQAVLDQLCAESLALDQYQTRLEGLALIAHRPLELRILHALVQYVRQIKVLALDAPGGADAEIADLARLVGGVSALRDPVEFLTAARWARNS